MTLSAHASRTFSPISLQSERRGACQPPAVRLSPRSRTLAGTEACLFPSLANDCRNWSGLSPSLANDCGNWNVPLPPRSRALPRSLARGFCWPLPFGENPFARCFPRTPFAKPDGSGCRRVGDPRRGSPTAKLSTGLFLLPFLRSLTLIPRERLPAFSRGISQPAGCDQGLCPWTLRPFEERPAKPF